MSPLANPAGRVAGSAIKHKSATRTAGDRTLTVTAAAVDTALNLTLPAVVGDVIEYSVVGLWALATTAAGFLDVCSLVAGAPVNYFGNFPTDNGIPGWWGTATILLPISGSAWKTMVAGDLVADTVTLQLMAKGSVAGKLIYGSVTYPLRVMAKNLGPVAA